MTDPRWSPPKLAHLKELVRKYGSEHVLKRLYEHVWWDDCTPSDEEEARRWIEDIVKEDYHEERRQEPENR
jgi:hypothetical protein